MRVRAANPIVTGCYQLSAISYRGLNMDGLPCVQCRDLQRRHLSPQLDSHDTTILADDLA